MSTPSDNGRAARKPWFKRTPAGSDDARNTPISRCHRLMLRILADYCRNKPYCWAGNDELAGHYGCTVRAVQVLLGAMEEAGLIRRVYTTEGRPGRIGIILRQRLDSEMPTAPTDDDCMQVERDMIAAPRAQKTSPSGRKKLHAPRAQKTSPGIKTQSLSLKKDEVNQDRFEAGSRPENSIPDPSTTTTQTPAAEPQPIEAAPAVATAPSTPATAPAAPKPKTPAAPAEDATRGTLATAAAERAARESRAELAVDPKPAACCAPDEAQPCQGCVTGKDTAPTPEPPAPPLGWNRRIEDVTEEECREAIAWYRGQAGEKHQAFFAAADYSLQKMAAVRPWLKRNTAEYQAAVERFIAENPGVPTHGQLGWLSSLTAEELATYDALPDDERRAMLAPHRVFLDSISADINAPRLQPPPPPPPPPPPIPDSTLELLAQLPGAPSTWPQRAAELLVRDFGGKKDRELWMVFLGVTEAARDRKIPIDILTFAYDKARGPKIDNQGAYFNTTLKSKGVTYDGLRVSYKPISA